MTERTFRIILGVVLLAALYFELPLVVYAYIGVLLFEGVTNWRVPKLVTQIQGESVMAGAGSHSAGQMPRFDFEAERALRIVVAVFLVLSYLTFNKELWFFPWFIGFALVGAGLSGICPMVMGLRWLGFR